MPASWLARRPRGHLSPGDGVRSAGALGVTMIVAIKSARWGDVDSLETLLGFDEFEYLALFLWLAIAGPGKFSLDHFIQRWYDGAVDSSAATDVVALKAKA